ncbi:hypothetical protein HDU76_013267 [Blyttiomyces sp. JEL0837]|nr:hypothetical protein HDU76_013267 [Blyttiomyces sp. JEL0837]
MSSTSPRRSMSMDDVNNRMSVDTIKAFIMRSPPKNPPPPPTPHFFQSPSTHSSPTRNDDTADDSGSDVSQDQQPLRRSISVQGHYPVIDRKGKGANLGLNNLFRAFGTGSRAGPHSASTNADPQDDAASLNNDSPKLTRRFSKLLLRRPSIQSRGGSQDAGPTEGSSGVNESDDYQSHSHAPQEEEFVIRQSVSVGRPALEELKKTGGGRTALYRMIGRIPSAQTLIRPSSALGRQESMHSTHSTDDDANDESRTQQQLSQQSSNRPSTPQFDVRRPQKESIKSRLMGSIRMRERKGSLSTMDPDGFPGGMDSLYSDASRPLSPSVVDQTRPFSMDSVRPSYSDLIPPMQVQAMPTSTNFSVSATDPSTTSASTPGSNAAAPILSRQLRINTIVRRGSRPEPFLHSTASSDVLLQQQQHNSNTGIPSAAAIAAVATASVVPTTPHTVSSIGQPSLDLQLIQQQPIPPVPSSATVAIAGTDQQITYEYEPPLRLTDYAQQQQQQQSISGDPDSQSMYDFLQRKKPNPVPSIVSSILSNKPASIQPKHMEVISAIAAAAAANSAANVNANIGNSGGGISGTGSAATSSPTTLVPSGSGNNITTGGSVGTTQRSIQSGTVTSGTNTPTNSMPRTPLSRRASSTLTSLTASSAAVAIAASGGSSSAAAIMASQTQTQQSGEPNKSSFRVGRASVVPGIVVDGVVTTSGTNTSTSTLRHDLVAERLNALIAQEREAVAQEVRESENAGEVTTVTLPRSRDAIQSMMAEVVNIDDNDGFEGTSQPQQKQNRGATNSMVPPEMVDDALTGLILEYTLEAGSPLPTPQSTLPRSRKQQQHSDSKDEEDEDEVSLGNLYGKGGKGSGKIKSNRYGIVSPTLTHQQTHLLPVPSPVSPLFSNSNDDDYRYGPTAPMSPYVQHLQQLMYNPSPEVLQSHLPIEYQQQQQQQHIQQERDELPDRPTSPSGFSQLQLPKFQLRWRTVAAALKATGSRGKRGMLVARAAAFQDDDKIYQQSPSAYQQDLPPLPEGVQSTYVGSLSSGDHDVGVSMSKNGSNSSVGWSGGVGDGSVGSGGSNGWLKRAGTVASGETVRPRRVESGDDMPGGVGSFTGASGSFSESFGGESGNVGVGGVTGGFGARKGVLMEWGRKLKNKIQARLWKVGGNVGSGGDERGMMMNDTGSSVRVTSGQFGFSESLRALAREDEERERYSGVTLQPGRYRGLAGRRESSSHYAGSSIVGYNGYNKPGSDVSFDNRGSSVSSETITRGYDARAAETPTPTPQHVQPLVNNFSMDAMMLSGGRSTPLGNYSVDAFVSNGRATPTGGNYRMDSMSGARSPTPTMSTKERTPKAETVASTSTPTTSPVVVPPPVIIVGSDDDKRVLSRPTSPVSMGEKVRSSGAVNAAVEKPKRLAPTSSYLAALESARKASAQYPGPSAIEERPTSQRSLNRRRPGRYSTRVDSPARSSIHSSLPSLPPTRPTTPAPTDMDLDPESSPPPTEASPPPSGNSISIQISHGTIPFSPLTPTASTTTSPFPSLDREGRSMRSTSIQRRHIRDQDAMSVSPSMVSTGTGARSLSRSSVKRWSRPMGRKTSGSALRSRRRSQARDGGGPVSAGGNGMDDESFSLRTGMTSGDGDGRSSIIGSVVGDYDSTEVVVVDDDDVDEEALRRLQRGWAGVGVGGSEESKDVVAVRELDIEVEVEMKNESGTMVRKKVVHEDDKVEGDGEKELPAIVGRDGEDEIAGY